MAAVVSDACFGWLIVLLLMESQYRRLSWKCPFILKAWAPLRVDTECDLSNMDSEDPILKDDIGTPRMKKHVFLPVELCQSDVLSQIRKVKCGLGDDVGRKCVGELIEGMFTTPITYLKCYSYRFVCGCFSLKQLYPLLKNMVSLIAI